MSNRKKPIHLPKTVDVVSLTLLSDALRKPMPKNFRWDFTDFLERDWRTKCGSVGCALGLAQIMRLIRHRDAGFTVFGLPANVCRAIFFRGDTYGKRMTEVTSTDVADKIDYYLAHGTLDE